MSKRERFLLWVLAGLLTWQAGVFTYGVHLCARVDAEKVSNVCPYLGDRFDTYVNTSLGAVLGLLAGSAVLSKRPED